MQQVTEQNGVAFIIVRFSAFERYFIVPYEVLQKGLESNGKWQS
ncbi:Holliday junction resolvase RecU [Lysinibacillus sp. MHQ-1]|nr:Holliday junction resolvase RecU [Lysinibacillus sp. MHQ-1]